MNGQAAGTAGAWPRRRGACLAGLLIALVSVSAPTPTRAQDRADVLIERAVQLRERGDDLAALPLLRRAVDLEATPRSFAQLGLVEQATGDFPNAELHLRRALAASRDDWVARRRAPLRRALAAVEARLATLALRLAEPVEGARLQVAGQSHPLPLRDRVRVTAGTVSLRVEAAGHSTVNRTLQIEAGDVIQELVNLDPLPPRPDHSAPHGAPTGAPLSDDDPGVHEQWWFWSVIALMVVGGGVGVGLGVALSDRSSGADTYASDDLDGVIFALSF